MENIEDNLSSKQKGNVIENRVSEIVTLSSNGILTCFSPNTDDDGIDLIVNIKGGYTPIFIQVKGRFILQKNGSYIQNVGKKTFKENKHFYLLFVYFDNSILEVKTVWLIPSTIFLSKAYFKKAGKNYKDFYRFNARPNSKADKWHKYIVDKKDLGSRIQEIMKETYKEELFSLSFQVNH